MTPRKTPAKKKATKKRAAPRKAGAKRAAKASTMKRVPVSVKIAELREATGARSMASGESAPISDFPEPISPPVYLRQPDDQPAPPEVDGVLGHIQITSESRNQGLEEIYRKQFASAYEWRPTAPPPEETNAKLTRNPWYRHLADWFRNL